MLDKIKMFIVVFTFALICTFVSSSTLMVQNVQASTTSQNIDIDCSASAYSGGGQTALGLNCVRNPDGISTVSVDPNVIPLGSYLYIEGYGYAVAADTGSAIKGNKIDIYLDSDQECDDWGVRNVKVTILGDSSGK